MGGPILRISELSQLPAELQNASSHRAIEARQMLTLMQEAWHLV